MIEAVPALVGSIVIVDILCIASLHMWFKGHTDELAIWELLLHKVKLGHNKTVATENICLAEGQGTVDPDGSRTNTWFAKMLKVREGHVGLTQNQQVALIEYQVRSASPCGSLSW